MNDLPISTMCFIRRNGETLMLQKRQGVLSGKWLPVGGKIAPGETPDECIRRETKEEAGLDLDKICLRGVITFVAETAGEPTKTSYAFVYECSVFTGALKSSHEGEVRWVADVELFTLDIPKKAQILPLIYGNSALFSAKYISVDGVLQTEKVELIAHCEE